MNGIFCIETKWEDSGYSVQKPLEFVTNCHGVRLEFRVAEDPASLDEHLKSWASRSDYDFPILYLGFHGFEKGLQARSGGAARSLWDYVRLEQIADVSDGNWRNCMVHFASCSTMSTPAESVADFLERSGLEGASGYTTDVDWVESMAFEVSYFNSLLAELGKGYLYAKHLRLCRDRVGNSPYTTALSRALGFTLAVKGDGRG